MNKTWLHLSLLLGLIAMNDTVQAQIYKHTDANGRVTYSNVPIKGATKLDIEPPSPNEAAPPPRQNRARTPTPADFPRVDRNTQNQRDSKRKDILQSELEIEKQALEEAKKAYAEGEAKPEVYRGAKGRVFRNVTKYQEKMQRLQAEVDLHKNNIELLEKELSALD